MRRSRRRLHSISILIRRATLLMAGVWATSVLAAAPAACGEKELPYPGEPSRTAGEARGGLRPQDLPDIVGFGKLTRAGNLWMKTTNIGVMGNPFTAISSDPSGQWPGPSGVEYLFYVGMWVGAVDPTSIDPTRRRRVSASTEWRPRSADPVDHIYECYAGMARGTPHVNDDHDGETDEDPINGIDDDGDGQIDEDAGVVGDQQFECVMRDDRPEAIEAATQEAHVPLGLEVRQTTYSFSTPELRDVVYVRQEFENVSGHDLDSVYVAYLVDQDVGPIGKGRYFNDDLPEPEVPQGPDPELVPAAFDDPLSPNAPYREVVDESDPKIQLTLINGMLVPLCPIDTIHVNGFTMTDDDGDDGETPGASTFLLLDHPTDLLSRFAPPHVGFHMYSYYLLGLSFAQGGLPTDDLERYQVISTPQHIDPQSGLIRAPRPDRAGDYLNLCSVGPFLKLKPGQRIRVVWALAVQREDRAFERSDRRRYRAIIQNAVTATVAYEGRNIPAVGVPSPSGPGRETPLRAEPGHEYTYSDCHDLKVPPPGMTFRPVVSQFDTWFDIDCYYCTGVPQHVIEHFLIDHPPPNPHVTLEAGDRKVTLLWDNFSEYTPDPETGVFDVAGYRIWKASNWKRPAGEVGPDETLWERLATYYYYDELRPFVERVVKPNGDTVTVKTPNVLVNRVWEPDNPLPRILYPQEVPCVRQTIGADLTPASPDAPPCAVVRGTKLGLTASQQDTTAMDFPVTQYPVGRWKLEDPLALNGFVYFYSITAFDSTGRGSSLQSLEGRRAALQGDGVVPQSSQQPSQNDGRAFVVPNPYRGGAGWDLSPNATDPTGTHLDFMNLPSDWTSVRIYTVSGDLVQTLRATDARIDGRLQKEDPADQEATWNLISRNGQDVVSGIYLFSIETTRGAGQVGRFVVIR